MLKNSRFAIIFTLGLLGTLQQALAQWPESALQVAAKYESPFESADLLTVVSGAHTQREGYKAQCPVHMLDIPSEYFASGYTNAYLSLARDQEGQPIKAPLLVYIPGLFADLQSNRPRYMIDLYCRRGYHVLFLTNPFSPMWIRNIPLHDPGYLEIEAAVIAGAIKTVQHSLELQSLLGKTHLVGESYGAFLSSIIASQNAQHKVISGDLTLFSPPLRIDLALDTLDELMDSQLATRNSIRWYQWPLFLKDLFSASSEREVSATTIKYSRALFAYRGVNERLNESLQELRKARGPLFKAPEDQGLQLRFRSYLKNLDPKLVLEFRGSKGALRHWIEATPTNFGAIRILNAADDELNVNQNKGLDELYPYMVTTRGGGHVGYIILPWFKRLLDESFGPQH